MLSTLPVVLFPCALCTLRALNTAFKGVLSLDVPIPLPLLLNRGLPISLPAAKGGYRIFHVDYDLPSLMNSRVIVGSHFLVESLN